MRAVFECWRDHTASHAFDVKAVNWTFQMPLEDACQERHDRWWCKECGRFWLEIVVVDDYGFEQETSYRQALICTDRPEDTYGPRVPWPCDAVTQLGILAS